MRKEVIKIQWMSMLCKLSKGLMRCELLAALALLLSTTLLPTTTTSTASATRLLAALLLDALALDRLDLLLGQCQHSVLESTHRRLQSTIRPLRLLLLSSCRRERVFDSLVVRSIVLCLLGSIK